MYTALPRPHVHVHINVIIHKLEVTICYQLRALNPKSTRIKGHVCVRPTKNLLRHRTLGRPFRRALPIRVAHARVASEEFIVA